MLVQKRYFGACPGHGVPVFGKRNGKSSDFWAIEVQESGVLHPFLRQKSVTLVLFCNVQKWLLACNVILPYYWQLGIISGTKGGGERQ